MQPYEHRQRGNVIYRVISVLAVIGILAAFFTHQFAAATVPVVLYAIAEAFNSLTIRVDADAVRWHFGWGWPGGEIAVTQIARAEITQTNLLDGWGIHWTIWHGWLWNTWGFQAVEISKRDGGDVTLGTDDPQGLFEAIERFRKGAA
jgi:hypothetical protein